MTSSRRLDDLEELMFPAAIAVGGLYLLYWTLSRTDRAAGRIDDVLSRDYGIFGEGDLIDRWTLNPGEVYRAVDRATISPWEAADMVRSRISRAGKKLRWRPW